MAYRVPEPGIRSKPQLQPTMPQMHQDWILNLLCQTGDRTCVPVLQKRLWSHCAMAGIPIFIFFKCSWFTMLCQFLSFFFKFFFSHCTARGSISAIQSKVFQSYIYIYIYIYTHTHTFFFLILLHLEWISNEVLLYSTTNYMQSRERTWWKRVWGKTFSKLHK